VSAGLGSLLHPERAPRVLVVGDMIIDRYVRGATDRVSPEAPIVVLMARDEEERAGGCGNVAANLAALGAEVRCVSVVGDDAAADLAARLLAAHGADDAGLVRDSSRPTIRKTRIVAQSQQLLRIDRERVGPLGAQVEERVLEAVRAALPDVDVVVLSDYGKGVLTPRVLEAVCARQRGRPRVLVDPKGRDYARYRGADLITPNRQEAELASGRVLASGAERRAAALELCALADLEAVLVTLGAEGMYCCLADGSAEWEVPARARAVYDVTGAGDTVIAVLAFALAAGGDLESAVRLANAAAGAAVQRFGVAVLSRDDIERALGESPHASAKIVDRGELLERVAAHRRDGLRVVLTNGCFDVLHVGHLHTLELARSHGDVLVVAVNDDASVRRLKGPARPVNALYDRLALLSGFECVSMVTPFSEDTPEALIRELTPDVLVKGADWAADRVAGQEWVERHGGRVVLVPLQEGRSTTRMLERLGHEPSATGGE